MPKETFFNLPDEKRQAITDILMEEFSEHDYKSVSISRIVARAGIAKGSFYQYFEDKKDCYLYLLQLGMDEKMNFMSRIPPPDQGIDIFAQLRWMMRVGTQFEFSNPRLAQISYRALFDDVPLPDETMALIRDGGKNYFRSLIEQGMATGTLKPEIDPEIGAFIFNTIFTNMGEHLLDRFGISPEQLLEGGAQTFKTDAMQTVFDQIISILEHGFRA